MNKTNSHKHNPNSMKSFDEFCVVFFFLCFLIFKHIEEYPCQNRKQPQKKEGEYNENDKNGLNKCIAGRT